MKANRIIAGFLLATSLAAPTAFAADKPPQGLPAEVITVQTQALDHSIHAVGNLRANETIQLSPEQSGRIEKVLFEEGQAVKQNDPLFVLDSAIYRAELRQADARVKLSQIAYKRAESLLKKRVGSEQDRDSTLAQLRVDEAQRALAKTRLDKMTIRAPFAGSTGLRLVSPGDYVNVGQELVELTDLNTMKVDFRVPEIYLAALQPGTLINVEVDAFPGRIFNGEVYAIAPSADTRSHNIEVRARIKNKDGLLRPGLFAKVNLVMKQEDAAIVVPEQAIIPQNGGFFVMRVADGNMVELVPVEMGQRRPGTVQITKGLTKGDVIITAGQIKLFPGMPVTPIFVDGSQQANRGE
ncbi:efflux RND transporter periplasmic adaptor subunit [Pontibacterium sp.]|uniref:efflux RND transporter periplasmic adaptor subunit n=1 Tax=Pontibacterium sp. TaxID=2036026 RepID=UPI00351357AA